jgi:hypothetical protein
MNKNQNLNTNCSVLQTGDKPEDHSHISHSKPITLKRQEMSEDPKYTGRYHTSARPEDMDVRRERAITKSRRGGAVRPLDGGTTS